MSRFSASRVSSLACIAVCAVSACGGGGSDDPPPPVTPPPRFASVDAAMTSAFATRNVPIGLSIYDRNGVKVHEVVLGGFSADQRVAIASASKLVSGVVLLRLVDQGLLSLDSTTAQVLGWGGPNGAITLRQLLSFTSGLDPTNLCTANAAIALADCVATISQAPTSAPPATRYDYGSTHLHTAARMAEVVTGANWNAVFGQQLRAPLGLPDSVEYYTFPRQAIGTTNPLVAGGLRMSMTEYAKVLRLVFDKGQTPGGPTIASALFDEQARQPYPNVTIGSSPAAANGFDFKYGFTAWLECMTPATGCATLSSPGAFGFTPWIDRTAGYYAILGMETTDVQGEVVNWALTLEQQLKPLIAQALSGQ
jgi:D-alanyl-D-alanine-carboxypeptidase/D-alanyl-D-alanine-endopeptidase